MATLPRPAVSGAPHWRPLRVDDLVQVAALEARIHIAPWTIGNFRDALAAGYPSRVGERDHRVVAYGVLMISPGEAQILNLSVVEEARREGIGRALLRHFIDDARNFCVDQLFLEVRASNVAALRLYESEGFAPIARRVSYYPGAATDDPREDAIVMRRAVDVAPR